VRIALEVEDGIDHVLEDARAGERPFLRHVADEDDRDAALLRTRVSCAAHSRTCATDPGAEVSALE
jgi:hypothetical protein